MGIAYVAAAFLVVPTLLLVFHRLSRPPVIPGPPRRDELPPQWHPPAHEPHPAPPLPAWVGDGSVADEAERWLRGRS